MKFPWSIKFWACATRRAVKSKHRCQQLGRVDDNLKKGNAVEVSRVWPLFHQDNARIHTARLTEENFLQPLSSPDTVPDYSGVVSGMGTYASWSLREDRRE